MIAKELLNQKRAGFEGILGFYKNDIATIRTNRATPAMVEDIKVDYYGQNLCVKELASITAPEPRTLVIQPWDKGATEAISGAIRKSEIGLNPIVDGQIIRLNIPPLTEEGRRELIKLLKQKTEEARVKIRRAREEIWDRIQKMEKAGEIREDDKFRGKDELQKMVDEYNGKIGELEKKKEGELMS
jgi:ribosome recycling factor